METKKETLDGIEKLDPFFSKIAKYDDKKESKEDEMIGKSSNRKLDEKWNVKIQFGVDFFNELFTFLNEMNYDTILRLSKQGIKIYVIDPSGTHLCYTMIDRTEMSEYINLENVENLIDNNKIDQNIEQETVIYVEFDMLNEISLNNKYPIDMYFDTKEKNTMYIVNGKTIESTRLKSLDNQDITIGTYQSYNEKLMNWLNNPESFIMNVSNISFGNVLKTLEKKKGEKDKSTSRIVEINFKKNEIEFLIKNEIKSSSIQMYGDDIAIQGERNVLMQLALKSLIKMAKLKLRTNVIFHINENLPFVIETKFGAGKINVYYTIAPRTDSEE